MADLRWYLKRDRLKVWLVVERRDDTRGLTVPVESRDDVRMWLPMLRTACANLDMPRPPLKTYDPVCVDA